MDEQTDRTKTYMPQPIGQRHNTHYITIPLGHDETGICGNFITGMITTLRAKGHNDMVWVSKLVRLLSLMSILTPGYDVGLITCKVTTGIP